MIHPVYQTHQKSEFFHSFFNIRTNYQESEKKIDFHFVFLCKKRMDGKVHGLYISTSV